MNKHRRRYWILVTAWLCLLTVIAWLLIIPIRAAECRLDGKPGGKVWSGKHRCFQFEPAIEDEDQITLEEMRQ